MVGLGTAKRSFLSLLSFKLLLCVTMLFGAMTSVSYAKSHLGYQSNVIKLDQLNFHYVEAGSGELIVFLHGFPYFGESWSPLLKPLSEKYHVVAPDHRGYGYSDKPESIDDYKINKLVEDVRLLITAFSKGQKVIVVGHDWGGVLGWGVAQKHPELVSKVVAINAPPFNAFIDSLANHQSQREASKYIPKMKGWIAKLYLAVKGADVFWGEGMQAMHAAGHVDDTFKSAFLSVWDQPDAIQSAIHWYRANVPDFDQINEQSYWPSRGSEYAIVKVPSLLIWSKGDKAFTDDTFKEIPKHVENMHVEVIDTSSHSPHLDHADKVLSFIENFIQQ